jgi:hypothetical protein
MIGYVHRINPHRTAKIVKKEQETVIYNSYMHGVKQNEYQENAYLFKQRFKEIENLNSYHKEARERIERIVKERQSTKVSCHNKLKKTVTQNKLSFKCLDCGYMPKSYADPDHSRKYLRRHAIKNGHRVEIKEERITVYEPMEGDFEG